MALRFAPELPVMQRGPGRTWFFVSDLEMGGASLCAPVSEVFFACCSCFADEGQRLVFRNANHGIELVRLKHRVSLVRSLSTGLKRVRPARCPSIATMARARLALWPVLEKNDTQGVP
jgi:hypothetical protein